MRVWVKDAEGNKKRKYIGYCATRQEALNLLSDYNQKPWNTDNRNKTFADVYELWVANNNLGPKSVADLKSKYRCHCQELYDIPYRELRPRHFRHVLDNCGKGPGTKNAIRRLFRQLDKTALEYEVIDKGYTGLLESYQVEDSHRKPFTEDEINRVWESRGVHRRADLVLLYLYTGFRRNEMADIKLENVDLENWFITGGSKTRAGKNRKVPVHKRIRPILRETVESARAAGSETLFGVSGQTLARWFAGVMRELGMDHVVHECRHTLRTRLDNAGANKRCVDLIMGHSSSDVGERVYTHKTLDQLQEAINLID